MCFLIVVLCKLVLFSSTFNKILKVLQVVIRDKLFIKKNTSFRRFQRSKCEIYNYCDGVKALRSVLYWNNRKMVSGIVAGRLALVTGAGSGIGRAACQVLSREGATVIAADKNYEAAAQTIKTHTSLASGRNDGDHSAVELDVSDSSSVKNLLQTVLKQYKNPPTIVVNSAGILRDNWMLKLSESDYDSVLDVNLKGTFLVMQTFAAAMAQASLPGSIVNISSIIGKYGNMGQTNYAASKAGVIAMTKSAAKELGKSNIRVNVILPGFVETPIIETVPDKVRQGFLKMVPLGRLGQPSEVAEVITFLSSDKSSFMTGAAIDVTGGF